MKIFGAAFPKCEDDMSLVKFKLFTTSSPPLSTLNNRLDPLPIIIFGNTPLASGTPVTFNAPVTTISFLRTQSWVTKTSPVVGILQVVLMLGPHPKELHACTTTSTVFVNMFNRGLPESISDVASYCDLYPRKVNAKPHWPLTQPE
jgi:hypothetical protein